ncbi:hypothetical protein ACH5RR_040087 [Cinchona calisaya]|uniref:Auxin-responsive protein n=1 Tax=Cinchona calisaya TaxID=153742 RepID=A0ABD2XU09_9GENT
MELELGLALPVSAHFSYKSFDLNISRQEEQPRERRLVKNDGINMEFKNLMIRPNKRGFEEAFGDEDDDDENTKLSLLVWSGRQPNDDEDGLNGYNRKPFNPLGKNDEEENDQIVGWPPIKSWRKKLLHQGGRVADQPDDQRANYFNGARNSIFVKVKMEGVIIGRKIDLSLFNSYQALTNTLLNMFAKYRINGDKDDDGPYILSYLDKERHWLIAGDVPWQTFIESVQRIEILKLSSC